MKLHRLLFYIYLFLIPIQTRILYKPEKAYIGWYFDYHLAFFLYLSDIVLFACLVAWIMFDGLKQEQIHKNRLFALILAFLILSLITLFHVKHGDLGIYQVVKWLEFFLIALYIMNTFINKRDFHIGMIVIFISAVFQAGMGWLQFHMQHMIGWNFLGEYIAPKGTAGLSALDTAVGKIIRAYGTMPHPNILGAFLILGLICGLYLFSSSFIKTTENKDETRNRIYVSVGLIIILIGIFATFSRMAWLAAALAIISFVSYYLWNKKKSEALLIFIVVAVSCATIFVLYPNLLRARITENNQVSINDRYFFNTLGWNIGSRFPIFGVGVGNYIDTLRDTYQLQPWQHQPPHNIFIFIFAELGVLGAGLFIFILFEIFRRIKEIFSDTLSFSLVLIGILFLLMSQFDHYFVTIQQGRLMFATVLGLIAALPNTYDFQKSR